MPGEVLVTGATGGVGSIATAILAKLGYDVVALSGKADAVEFLKSLGAGRVVTREECNDESSAAPPEGHLVRRSGYRGGKYSGHCH